MRRRNIVILLCCLGFGAADYFARNFPDAAFSQFVRDNNTVLGIIGIVAFSLLFFAGRRRDRR